MRHGASPGWGLLLLALYSACDEPKESVVDALDGGSLDSGHARDAAHPPVDGSAIDAGDAGGGNDAGDAACTPMAVPDPPSIQAWCDNGHCPDWNSALSEASEDDGGGLIDYTLHTGCGVDSIKRNVGSVHGYTWYFDHDTHELIGFHQWGDDALEPCEVPILITAGRDRGDCPTVTECDLPDTQLCTDDGLDGGA